METKFELATTCSAAPPPLANVVGSSSKIQKNFNFFEKCVQPKLVSENNNGQRCC